MLLLARPTALPAAVLAALLCLPASAREHPFLFLSADDLPALRQKARLPAFRQPVEVAAERSDEPEKPGDFKHLGQLLNFNLVEFVTARIDRARRPQVARLHELLSGWPGRVPKMGFDHPDTVVAAGALFTSIVALDLIGPDLSDEARLVARHRPGPDGHARFLTAILPGDGTQPVPDSERVTGPGFSGVRVAAGPGVEDHALVLKAGEAEAAGVALTGEAAWLRRRGDTLTKRVVVHGTGLRVTTGTGVGFTASFPVSVVVSGRTARIRCERATRIAVDGIDPVDLPAGTHEIGLD